MAEAMRVPTGDASASADELVQEFVDSRGQRLATDRRRGVLRGVKLLGLVSKNGRTYREGALRSAMHLYDGAKVNVNHPHGDPLGPRDYRDRLGVIRNVSLRPSEGLFGDLHYNPNHALAEQLAWDAEHSPENVGLSHNVAATTRREGDTLVVESIARVHSVDLVADPATTSGLYEQAEPRHEEPSSDPPLGNGAEEAAVESAPTAVADDEVDALREELGSLRHAELVRAVLKEHGFAGPDDPLLDESLMAAIEATRNESVVRDLVEQRAALVSRVRETAAAAPVCESRAADPLGSGDARKVDGVEEFLRSVTRR